MFPVKHSQATKRDWGRSCGARTAAGILLPKRVYTEASTHEGTSFHKPDASASISQTLGRAADDRNTAPSSEQRPPLWNTCASRITLVAQGLGADRHEAAAASRAYRWAPETQSPQRIDGPASSAAATRFVFSPVLRRFRHDKNPAELEEWRGALGHDTGTT